MNTIKEAAKIFVLIALGLFLIGWFVPSCRFSDRVASFGQNKGVRVENVTIEKPSPRAQVIVESNSNEEIILPGEAPPIARNGADFMPGPPPGGFMPPGPSQGDQRPESGRMVQTGAESVKRTSNPVFDGFTAIDTKFKRNKKTGKVTILDRDVRQVGKNDPGLMDKDARVHPDHKVHFHMGQLVSGGDIFEGEGELNQILAQRQAMGLDNTPRPRSGPPAPPQRRR